MRDKQRSIGVPLLALGFLGFAMDGAVADGNEHWGGPRGVWAGHSSVCERTADRMLKACLFELGQTQQTTLANCLNIADGDERAACVSDAHDSRREEGVTCFAVHEARGDACELLDEDRYAPDPLANPAIAFVDPNLVGDTYAANPYVSVAAGHTYVLRAGEAPDFEETVVVHVTDESREILGASCRIIKDLVFEVDEEGEYELVEYTDDWFAQDTNGNVYYCGEIARNYEDGILRDLGGSFEAGIDFAKAGELVRFAPAAGEAHRQEYALGEAEDIAQYLSLDAHPGLDEGGENPLDPAFECEANGGCLKMLEFSPLEPDASEFKYYVAGVGFVLAVGIEDGEITGEREELVCVGDSLDVLDGCGLADAEALREQLCEIDPATFCASED